MQEFLVLRSSSTHPDLLTSRIRRDQSGVLAVQDKITSMFINPFEEMELISLSSGVVPTDKVTSDLLDAELIGERELLKFQDERLKKQTINYYEPLKKMKLGTFSTLFKKSVKVKANVQFSTQSDIFGKISLIQQLRPLNLKEVFCYPLGPVPWSLLATSACELMKISKATLMHELEKGSTSVDGVQRPFATIIDGMALVRKCKHAGHTFDSFADELLKSAVSSSIGASRIDIVFDVYREHSIKNTERGHRETGKLQFKQIIGNQTIKQYAAFLSSRNNKLVLIRFLVSRWQTNCFYIGNTEVNVAFDESCIQLGSGNGNNTNVEDLSCNHEEADTRLLFHAKKDQRDCYENHNSYP